MDKLLNKLSLLKDVLLFRINASAIKLTNPGLRNTYIDVRFHFVRRFHFVGQKDRIKIEHVTSEEKLRRFLSN